MTTHLSQSTNGLALDAPIWTGLASLANGGYAISAAVNNTPTDGTTYSYDLGDLTVTFGSSVTAAAGAYLTVWVLPQVDGANYPNPPGTTAGAAAPALSQTFPQSAGAPASGFNTYVCPNLILYPYNFLLLVQNNLGIAFPATVTAKLQRKTMAVW